MALDSKGDHLKQLLKNAQSDIAQSEKTMSDYAIPCPTMSDQVVSRSSLCSGAASGRVFFLPQMPIPMNVEDDDDGVDTEPEKPQPVEPKPYVRRIIWLMRAYRLRQEAQQEKQERRQKAQQTKRDAIEWCRSHAGRMDPE